MGGELGLPRSRSRLAWWVVGGVLGIAVLFVLYAFVGTVVLGLFMYYATRPVYERMARRLDFPGVAAAAALLAVALPVVVLVAYAIAVSASEVAAIAGEPLAEYEGVLRPYLDLSSLRLRPQQMLDFVRANREEWVRFGGPELLGGVVNALAAFGTALLQLFVALALAFYLLRDDDRLARWFVRDIADERSTAYAYAAAVDSNLRTVYFGSILNAFVVTLVAAVAFNIADFVAPPGLSIPLPTLLGLLTGIASLVPVVGTKLVYLPVTAYLVARALGRGVVSLWFPIAVVLVFAVVVDRVTEVAVRPYLTDRELHGGLMLFAYIFGPLLFGWYGIFLGPLLLVLLVQFGRIVLPKLIRGEPISTPPAGREKASGTNDDGTENEGDATEKAGNSPERERRGGKTESGGVGREDEDGNEGDEGENEEDGIESVPPTESDEDGGGSST
ncbi:AI-2E family transporter [Haladaptatus halobius]|uniref:AI-2E family transporter n=1 Tax=Haladaptatus halobius TaxID=2884875 RepID=UPI001D0BA205|nr:AI-2E family transporter [Haladaptatus halobius]